MFRVLRAVLALLLVSLLAVAGALALLDTTKGHEVLRRVLVSQLRKILPGLSVEAIEGSLYSDIVLRGVVLRDRFGGEVATADRIRVKYTLSALLAKHIDANQVEIEDANLLVFVDDRGSNVSNLIAASESDDNAPFRFPLLITVRDAAIRNAIIRIEQPNGELLRFTDTALFFSGRVSAAGLVAVVAKLQTHASGLSQNAHLTLSGEVEYMSELRGSASLELTRADYSPVTLSVLANGPFEQVLAEIARTVGGEEHLRAIGYLSTLDLLHGYAGKVRIHDLNASDVLAFLPPVTLSAQGVICEHALVGTLDLQSQNQSMPLSGHTVRWNGALNARIDTTHPKSKLALTLTGAPLSFDKFSAEKLHFTAAASSNTVAVKGSFTPHGGVPVTIEATVPLELSVSPQLHDKNAWKISVSAPKFPLGWVAVLVKDEFVKADRPRGYLDATLNIDGTLDAADARLTLTTHGATYKGLSKLDFEMALTAKGARTITADAGITLRGRRTLIVGGEIKTSVREILAGVSLLTAPVSAHAELLPTDITRYGDLLEALHASTGWLSAKGSAHGTFKKLTASANAHLRNATYAGLSLGVIDAYADYEDGGLRASLKAPAFSHGSITVGATLGPQVGDRQMDLRAIANIATVDIAPFASFIPSVRRLTGTLDAHVEANGPLQNPVLEGHVNLHDATADAWRLPSLTNIALQASIVKNLVTLKTLDAKVGINGALHASGTLSLHEYFPSDGTVDVAVTAVPLPIRGMSDLRLSGAASAKLSTTGGRLKIAATLAKGMVDLPVIQIPKPLRSSGSLADLRFVGLDPLLEPESAQGPSFDLTMIVEPLRVRGKDIDMTATSKISIENNQGETIVSGDTTLSRGNVAIFNRRWEVERARLLFGGTVEINPAVDVALTRQFSNAFVTLQVRGTIKNPELVLLSDPPLDRAQIVSLVVTGGASSKASDSGTAIAAAALTQLFGGFTSNIVSRIGIDVVRVDMENSSTRLELGKYLGERIYVGYRRLLGAGGDDRNGNELRLEYRLTDRLMFESAFGDAGIGGLELIWTYRY